jgi:triosephosphate isomerase
MREFLIAGNWKMNGSMVANKQLVAGIIDGVPAGGGFSLLVCPPFPYIAAIAAQAHGSAVSVGAQNVSEHEKGMARPARRWPRSSRRRRRSA